MRFYEFRRGTTFDKLMSDFVSCDVPVMEGSIKNAWKLLTGYSALSDMIVPSGYNHNNIGYLYDKDLCIRIFDMNIVLIINNVAVTGKLTMHDNYKLSKFTTVLQLPQLNKKVLMDMSTVLAKCDSDNVSFIYDEAGNVTLTAAGQKGFVNMFNFIFSYRESVRLNNCTLVKLL